MSMSSNSSDTKVNTPTPSDSSESSGDLLNKDKYPQESSTAFHPINRTPQWRDSATPAQSPEMTFDNISSRPPSPRQPIPATRRIYRRIAPRSADSRPHTNTTPTSHARVHTSTSLAPPIFVPQQIPTAPSTDREQSQSFHHPRKPQSQQTVHTPHPPTSPAPRDRPVEPTTTLPPATATTRTSNLPPASARDRFEDVRIETEDELAGLRRRRRDIQREREILRARERELVVLAGVVRDLPEAERRERRSSEWRE
ncbi:hypothetical protein BDV97DRAFT_371065 [Delphinella strobiligena]|nr:hypothetical protein BDV97DRAFT_371065 [Delphinella strobiligena]